MREEGKRQTVRDRTRVGGREEGEETGINVT